MYIFVAVFVSAITMTVNALHKINCVTDCKSICYTIYNILCNAFTLVFSKKRALGGVAIYPPSASLFFGSIPKNKLSLRFCDFWGSIPQKSMNSLITQVRACDNVMLSPLAQRSRVKTETTIAGTLPAPSIYLPFLLVYARWSLLGHKEWRNEHAIVPFKFFDYGCF